MINGRTDVQPFPLPPRRLMQSIALGLAILSLALLSACTAGSRGTSETGPEKAQVSVRVGVVTAVRKDLVRNIALPGTLVAFKEATLYGKVAGYLRSISVDKGDRVRRGQTLGVIEVPEMVKEVDQAEAAYREALASLNRAKAQAELEAATYERYQQVHSKDPDAIAKQELDEYRSKSEVAQAEVNLMDAKVAAARASHERLVALSRYALITAPFSGVVTARFVDPGALIQAATSSNQPILTEEDLCTIRVYESVPETDVPMIRKGTPATLTTAAYPGKEFRASVTRFAEALDPATRTMKTEIDVLNPGHLLRPGMYANVSLELQKKPGAVVVPDTAVVVESGEKLVYVVTEGKARRVRVEIGLDDGTQAEIRSGLKGGEQVVVAGKENLTDGKAVEASAVGQGKS